MNVPLAEAAWEPHTIKDFQKYSTRGSETSCFRLVAIVVITLPALTEIGNY